MPMKYLSMMLALALTLGVAGAVQAGGCGGGDKEKSSCGKCTKDKSADECKKECGEKKKGEGC